VDELEGGDFGKGLEGGGVFGGGVGAEFSFLVGAGDAFGDAIIGPSVLIGEDFN
jgi:hypothetical protein